MGSTGEDQPSTGDRLPNAWKHDHTKEIPNDGDVVSWLKNEMRKDLHETLLREVYGPAIYGVGNFEIYKDEHGEWDLRSIE